LTAAKRNKKGESSIVTHHRDSFFCFPEKTTIAVILLRAGLSASRLAASLKGDNLKYHYFNFKMIAIKHSRPDLSQLKIQ
jgi:hypothetical protein